MVPLLNNERDKCRNGAPFGRTTVSATVTARKYLQCPCTDVLV